MGNIWTPDNRLEHPALLSGNAPTAPVKIDWNHKYTEHLIASWAFLGKRLFNLVPGSPLGDGVSDSFIERKKLISPSGQPSGDDVLFHQGMDVSVNGGSIVVKLKLDSYPNSYGTIACIDEMENSDLDGFAVGIQNTNKIFTYRRYSSQYTGTKQLAITLGDIITISTSIESSYDNHILIVDGVTATVAANDYWKHRPGLVRSNTYSSTRGDLVGEYHVYHVFDKNIGQEALMSLNKNPHQFYIPA